jgi:hypothetical protein
MTSKIFISGFRALRQDQPEDILQEVFAKMKATNVAVLVVGTVHELQRHQDIDQGREKLRNDWDNKVRRIIDEHKIDFIAEEAGDDHKAWKDLKQGDEVAAAFGALFDDGIKIVDHPAPPIAKVIADELKIRHEDIDVDIRADEDPEKVEERSEAMTKNIVDGLGDAKRVLVIVGHDHLNGIAERLRKRNFDARVCGFPR